MPSGESSFNILRYTSLAKRNRICSGVRRNKGNVCCAAAQIKRCAVHMRIDKWGLQVSSGPTDFDYPTAVYKITIAGACCPHLAQAVCLYRRCSVTRVRPDICSEYNQICKLNPRVVVCINKIAGAAVDGLPHAVNSLCRIKAESGCFKW